MKVAEIEGGQNRERKGVDYPGIIQEFCLLPSLPTRTHFCWYPQLAPKTTDCSLILWRGTWPRRGRGRGITLQLAAVRGASSFLRVWAYWGRKQANKQKKSMELWAKEATSVLPLYPLAFPHQQLRIQPDTSYWLGCSCPTRAINKGQRSCSYF